jgi:AcrR family transcriptional regulator
MSTVARIHREELFNTAADLFREKGYPAASMRELASRLGVEAPSLYNHIRSKADLLDHICFRAASAFTDGLDVISRQPLPPLEKLRLVIALHVRIATDDPASQTVFNDEWKHLPPDRLQLFLDMRRRYEQGVLAFLEEAQAAGQLRDIPLPVILRTFLAGMRWLHLDRQPGAGRDQGALTDYMTSLFLHGLAM